MRTSPHELWRGRFATKDRKLFQRIPERDFDPAEAFDRLVRYLDGAGLSYDLLCFGDEPYSVYKSYIYDHRESRQWIGGGKGFGQQCITSALAESLQHHISFDTISRYAGEQMPRLTVSELLDSPALAKFDKYRKIFERGQETSLLAMSYQGIDRESASEGSFHYPVALTEPRYDKLPGREPVAADWLLWRSHDTGSALGLTYDECLLHGMTEWIEKHSLSLFFLRNFFEPDPGDRTISYLDKTTLPGHLHDLVTHIESRFDDDLSIVLVNNDFEIPCMLTLFTRQSDCIAQPKGLGCSLHAEFAVEKSIFEALQCRLLHNSTAKAREQAIAANFRRYPLFFAAYTFAIAGIRRRMVGYPDLPVCGEVTVAQQVSTIAGRLIKAGGHRAYSHVYQNDPGGLTSLHVLIPGLNETFLIKEGKFLIEPDRSDG